MFRRDGRRAPAEKPYPPATHVLRGRSGWDTHTTLSDGKNIERDELEPESNFKANEKQLTVAIPYSDISDDVPPAELVVTTGNRQPRELLDEASRTELVLTPNLHVPCAASRMESTRGEMLINS